MIFNKYKYYLQLIFLMILACQSLCQAEVLEKTRGVYTLMRQAEKVGKIDDAVKLALLKLKIEQETYGSDSPELGVTLSYVVKYLVDAGLYFHAIPYAKRSLELAKQYDGVESIETATALSSISVLYSQIGEFDEALDLLNQAIKIFEKTFGVYSIDYAIALDNLANLYFIMGNYSDAIATGERARKIFAEIRPVLADIVKNLNNLASFYAAAGDNEKSISLFKKIITRKSEIFGPKHPSTLVSINNMGEAYLNLGNYTEAESCFKKFDSKVGMAKIYLATGQPSKALDLLEKEPPSIFTRSPYLIEYFTIYGTTLARLERWQAAAHNLAKAIRLIEEMRHHIKGERTGFFGNIKINYHAYKEMVGVLAAMANKGETLPVELESYGPEPASAAFFFAEGTKGRVLLEAIAEAARPQLRTSIPGNLSIREKNLVNQLIAVENYWSRYFKHPKGSFDSDEILEETRIAKKNLDDRRMEVTTELEELIKTLRKAYPLYAALYYPQPLMARELSLQENEVLLEYALGDKACYVFVVRKGEVPVLHHIPLGQEALESKINNFMKPLLHEGVGGFSSEKGKELYDLLLANPLATVKAGEKIIIVPEGVLGLLPFEALVMERGTGELKQVFLGDFYLLTYYQSATVMTLQRRMKEEKTSRPLFALGDPIYNENDPRYQAYKHGKPVPRITVLAENGYRALATNWKWGKIIRDDPKGITLDYNPLPETAEEIREIAKIWAVQPELPNVLLEAEANETQLRQAPLQEYRYLHFATHADLPGKVQGKNEPFILLGQVENKGKDDGFLTLSEVLDLKLRAEMVVLSACLTGHGKVMAGEGVMNFARAFQYAGARSVVVSLWPVKSRVAVEFMKIFYGHLKAGKGRATALFLTRQEIKKEYPDPFLWAVFVLHGEG
jgi:CHAT domain-containing protein